MAVISPDTFDPVRQYVSVRLASGVPVVDADANERDDMRRWELRAFLRWFVGDGVPAGNDGFRIVANRSADDFVIAAGGDALPAIDAGRILVDGTEVFIRGDVAFTAQPLHAGQAGAAALAAAWGVPVVAAVPPPPASSATRTLTVYLDSWERLVTADEDPSLILASVGVESCSRLKREWVVRVREGTTVPQSGDSDFLVGHATTALAEITQTSAGTILAADVTDRRRRGVKLSSELDLAQVIGDAFGASYATDGTGTPQLLFSLREVMNAMLAERPAVVGPTTVVGGGPHNNPAALIDAGGTPWVFWIRSEGSDRFLSFVRRVGGVWTAPDDAFQFTVTGVPVIDSLAAAPYPDGTLRVFWTQSDGGNTRVFTRRFASGSWDARETVQGSGNNGNVVATVEPSGMVTAAWLSSDTVDARCYPVAGPPSAVETVGAVTTPADIAITVAPTGVAEVFYVEQQASKSWPVHANRRTGGAWEAAFTDLGVPVPVEHFADIAVTYSGSTAPSIYYATRGEPNRSQLRAKRLEPGAPAARNLTPPNLGARFPSLVGDLDGNAQLFFQNDLELQLLGLIQKV